MTLRYAFSSMGDFEYAMRVARANKARQISPVPLDRIERARVTLSAVLAAPTTTNLEGIT